MGLMDSAKNLAAKGKQMAAGHEDKVDSALDRAAQEADSRTGGAHTEHIEKGRDAADRYLGSDGPGTDGPGTDGPRTDAPRTGEQR